MQTIKETSIAVRIAAGVTAVLVLTVAVIIPLTLHRTESIVRSTETDGLAAIYQSVENAIAAEAQLAETMSAVIANLPQSGAALASADREGLTRMYLPAFEALKKQYAMEQFQFHTPPATSFLRLHNLQKFGDDLSSFRATVVAANRDTKPIRGLESGVAGLGIRGVYPVRHDGVHVGTVEFGVSFGQAFFDRFKSRNGVDVALHLVKGDGFETFAKTQPSELLTSAELSLALSGSPQVRYSAIADVPVTVYGRAVLDYQGNPIGVLEIARDRTQILAEIAATRNLMLLIAVLTLGVGIGIAVWIGRSIARPIRETVDALQQIADGDGDLSRRLAPDGMHELRALGAGFNGFMEKITDIVSSVREISHQVAMASGRSQREMWIWRVETRRRPPPPRRRPLA